MLSYFDPFQCDGLYMIVTGRYRDDVIQWTCGNRDIIFINKMDNNLTYSWTLVLLIGYPDNNIRTSITNNPKMSRKSHNDRFIHEKPVHNPSPYPHSESTCPSDKYQKFLYREMIANQPHNQGLSFDSQLLGLMAGRNGEAYECVAEGERIVSPHAEKILDAPEIKDDYYLNLLDWSSRGVLSIGLAEKVYLYSPKQISQLCIQQNDNYICSLNFHPQGSLLSVGLCNGKTQIYDIQSETLVRTVKGHSQRVSSSAFTYGLLYTGSRDSLILGHDIRAHHNVVMKLQGHRGQVCGLKHDACGLASGSNDDLAIVWDINMGKPRFNLQGHKGAVKALSWCPWQRNLLITGGGTSDKTMRMWNIQTGKCINTLNTDSQVCSIVCNPDQRQIVSSHGYSQNQLSIWRVDKSTTNYINCHKVMQLYGHTQRVLHMALSPDASTVCTASADETLRFWKVFNSGYSKMKEGKYCKDVGLEECSLR